MKILPIIATLLVLAVLIAGCAPAERPGNDNQGPDSPTTGEGNGDEPNDEEAPELPSFDFGQNQKDDLGNLGGQQ